MITTDAIGIQHLDLSDSTDIGAVLTTEQGDEAYFGRPDGARLRIVFPQGFARKLGILFASNNPPKELS